MKGWRWLATAVQASVFSTCKCDRVLSYSVQCLHRRVVKGQSEECGLDRRGVLTKLKLSRRGTRTAMGHVGGAMWLSYSYSDRLWTTSR